MRYDRAGDGYAVSEGLVAEWLRRGLQILAPRFDSGRGLQRNQGLSWKTGPAALSSDYRQTTDRALGCLSCQPELVMWDESKPYPTQSADPDAQVRLSPINTQCSHRKSGAVI